MEGEKNTHREADLGGRKGPWKSCRSARGPSVGNEGVPTPDQCWLSPVKVSSNLASRLSNKTASELKIFL